MTVGKRRHRATIRKHNGQLDDHNIPTKDVDEDWQVVSEDWPCEIQNKGGGETIRGRQTTAKTTHVLVGEYYGAKVAGPEMRAHVDQDGTERIYNIVAAYDPAADNREIVIEATIET